MRVKENLKKSDAKKMNFQTKDTLVLPYNREWEFNFFLTLQARATSDRSRQLRRLR